MKYFKVENGIVTQVICNPREGYTETDENVIPGMLFDGEVFTTPDPKAKSPYAIMSELELTRTPRREREARMGVLGSQQWLDDLDAEIEALRP